VFIVISVFSVVLKNKPSCCGCRVLGRDFMIWLWRKLWNDYVLPRHTTRWSDWNASPTHHLFHLAINDTHPYFKDVVDLESASWCVAVLPNLTKFVARFWKEA